MWFREIIWNYSFLSNLLAGFLIMVLTVTLIAYIINWLEKRRTRFVKYNILEGLRVTIGTLMISLIDIVGFEDPGKFTVSSGGGVALRVVNAEEKPTYLGKARWLFASYSDLPKLWWAALKKC